eukprot:gene10864-7530_t
MNRLLGLLSVLSKSDGIVWRGSFILPALTFIVRVDFRAGYATHLTIWWFRDSFFGMPRIHLQPPGVPQRIQPYPFYELNFSKDGMQLIHPISGTSSLSLNALEVEVEGFLQKQLVGNVSASLSRENSGSLFLTKRGSSFPIRRDEFKQILHTLPQRYQFYQWNMVYDTAIHGCSLQNFYRSMDATFLEDAGAIGLFLVRDHTEAHESTGGVHENSSPANASCSIIGCFTPVVPCEILRGTSHEGSPETQVFRLETVEEPQATTAAQPSKPYGIFSKHVPSTPPPPKGKSRRIKSYRWCRDLSNNRFLRCHATYLSIGGGEHGPALWIDANIQNGTSSRFCETFRCPPLFGTAPSSLPHSEFRIERMLWVAMNMRHVLHADQVPDPLGSTDSTYFEGRAAAPFWELLNNPTDIEQQVDFQ